MTHFQPTFLCRNLRVFLPWSIANGHHKASPNNLGCESESRLESIPTHSTHSSHIIICSVPLNQYLSILVHYWFTSRISLRGAISHSRLPHFHSHDMGFSDSSRGIGISDTSPQCDLLRHGVLGLIPGHWDLRYVPTVQRKVLFLSMILSKIRIALLPSHHRMQTSARLIPESPLVMRTVSDATTSLPPQWWTTE